MQWRHRSPPSDWLVNAKGRAFQSSKFAVGFHLFYQRAEGTFWRRWLDATGAPLMLPLALSRAAFMIDRTAGCYQLIPVNESGMVIGNPPDRIDVA